MRTLFNVQNLVRDAFTWRRDGAGYLAGFSSVTSNRSEHAPESISVEELMLVNEYLPQIIEILHAEDKHGDQGKYALGSMVRSALSYLKDQLVVVNTSGDIIALKEVAALTMVGSDIKISATCSPVCKQRLVNQAGLPVGYVVNRGSLWGVSLSRSSLDEAAAGWEKRLATASALGLPVEESVRYMLVAGTQDEPESALAGIDII